MQATAMKCLTYANRRYARVDPTWRMVSGPRISDVLPRWRVIALPLLEVNAM
jgi:hypothetical protein